MVRLEREGRVTGLRRLGGRAGQQIVQCTGGGAHRVGVGVAAQHPVRERLGQRLLRPQGAFTVEAVAAELVQPVPEREVRVASVVVQVALVQIFLGAMARALLTGVVERVPVFVRDDGTHGTAQHFRGEPPVVDTEPHPIAERLRAARVVVAEDDRFGEHAAGRVQPRLRHADHLGRQTADTDAAQVHGRESIEQIDHGPGVFAHHLGIETGQVEPEDLEVGTVHRLTQVLLQPLADLLRTQVRPFVLARYTEQLRVAGVLRVAVAIPRNG
ncbi:hypothetical protein NG2371_05291 [Nocardia gamkensis]|nr:hypothetical protein [Nocardia gamkensis]